MNVHLAAENIRHRGCEHAHDLGITGLDNALREYLCVIKQINIILQKIKTKFLNVEAAVGNTVDKRMVQIAFPDVLRCGKQSFGGFVVQGGTPNESMLMIFLRLTAKFCRQHFSCLQNLQTEVRRQLVRVQQTYRVDQARTKGSGALHLFTHTRLGCFSAMLHHLRCRDCGF